MARTEKDAECTVCELQDDLQRAVSALTSNSKSNRDRRRARGCKCRANQLGMFALLSGAAVVACLGLCCFYLVTTSRELHANWERDVQEPPYRVQRRLATTMAFPTVLMMNQMSSSSSSSASASAVHSYSAGSISTSLTSRLRQKQHMHAQQIVRASSIINLPDWPHSAEAWHGAESAPLSGPGASCPNDTLSSVPTQTVTCVGRGNVSYSVNVFVVLGSGCISQFDRNGLSADVEFSAAFNFSVYERILPIATPSMIMLYGYDTVEAIACRGSRYYLSLNAMYGIVFQYSAVESSGYAVMEETATLVQRQFLPQDPHVLPTPEYVMLSVSLGLDSARKTILTEDSLTLLGVLATAGGALGLAASAVSIVWWLRGNVKLVLCGCCAHHPRPQLDCPAALATPLQ